MDDQGQQRNWRRIWPWIGLVLIAYLVPFAMWVVDTVFNAGSRYNSLGRGAHDLFQTVYWPMLELIRILFY
jgi:hypothetical protein